jgi:hypothetical protein
LVDIQCNIFFHHKFKPKPINKFLKHSNIPTTIEVIANDSIPSLIKILFDIPQDLDHINLGLMDLVFTIAVEENEDVLLLLGAVLGSVVCLVDCELSLLGLVTGEFLVGVSESGDLFHSEFLFDEGETNG